MSSTLSNNLKPPRGPLNTLALHNERKATDPYTHSNKNIDINRTAQNVFLIESDKPIQERIDDRIKEVYDAQEPDVKGNKPKPNPKSPKYVTQVITPGEDFAEKATDAEKEAFLRDQFELVKEQADDPRDIVSAVIHKDETNMHLHIIRVPMVTKTNKKGKTNTRLRKNDMLSPSALAKIQRESLKRAQDFDTEKKWDFIRRPEGESGLSMEEYKAKKNAEFELSVVETGLNGKKARLEFENKQAEKQNLADHEENEADAYINSLEANELDSRESTLNARDEALRASERDLKARQAQADARDKAQDERDKAQDARESSLEAHSDVLDAREANTLELNEKALEAFSEANNAKAEAQEIIANAKAYAKSLASNVNDWLKSIKNRFKKQDEFEEIIEPIEPDKPESVKDVSDNLEDGLADLNKKQRELLDSQPDEINLSGFDDELHL